MATTAREPRAPGEPDPAPGRVVGIDPGLGVTGYAVVEPTARGPYVVEAGVIRPRGASRKTLEGRLLVIHQGVLEVLDAFPPSALALEQVHSHVNHPRTAILMAHARGVIVLAAAERGVPVVGYAADPDQEDADRQRQGAQGADAARDPGRAGPGPAPRAPRRRRRLRRGPLPLPDRPEPPGARRLIPRVGPRSVTHRTRTARRGA